jgi:DNA-directed RNA polymerase specialized sigma24 family protein
MQRQVVVLVGSYGFSHREVAELLSIGASTVQKHLERGLAKLRVSMGVFVDG